MKQIYLGGFALVGAFAMCVPIQAQEKAVSTGICAGGGGPAGPCRPISGGSMPVYSGPSPAEIEAEREREAERQRLAELKRQAELERQRQEEERKRAQEAFEAAVRDAAAHLKGVDHGDMGLKGVSGNNTAFFGLKGVSAADAGIEVKMPAAGGTSADLSTPSKQLACVASLSGYAFQHARNIVAGAGTQADLDEISYLSGAAGRVFDGQSPGVECNSSGVPAFTKAPDLKAIAPAYKAGMDKLVHDSQRVYDLHRQSAEAAQQIADAQKRADSRTAPRPAQAETPPPAPTAKPPQTADEADIARKFAESKQWQERDFKENIEPVIQQQKENQQKQDDACEPCRLLQSANATKSAVDAQNSAAIQALREDVKSIGELVTGNTQQ